MRTHPHAEATYQVISLPDGAFGVRVSIPDRLPTTVSSFATEAAADAWIARTKQRIATEGESGKWFRRTPPQWRAPGA